MAQKFLGKFSHLYQYKILIGESCPDHSDFFKTIHPKISLRFDFQLILRLSSIEPYMQKHVLWFYARIFLQSMCVLGLKY